MTIASRTHQTFDAIVIGAGEAGSVVASRAVSAGASVAMIYRPPYGSTCLNAGCVPSKFLIHRASVAHVARTAARFHVHTSGPSVDLAAIVAEKNAMIDDHRAESLRNAQAADRLTLVEGEARFVTSHRVAAGGRSLEADRIFIATGMRPAIPEIQGLECTPYLTSETLMEVTDLPAHLVCIGGGYVACELGQAFRRFGSAVTLVQSADHLCPDEEPDVSTLLERTFAAEGITVVLGHRAMRVEASADGVRVVARAQDGRERAITGTHLLVAAGRRPNSDMLALENAGIRADRRGFITVTDRLETNVPGIWAIGDVNGVQPFTRCCQEEGKIAYANAFEHADLAIVRRALGHAVFTDPSIGSVGLTERRARDLGHDVAAGLITFDQIAKAELIVETTGLIKYVVDGRTRELLGCHVMGPAGAELVYDAIVVMRHRGRLDELAFAVGIFPTLQEGMEGAARGLLRDLAPQLVAGPLAAVHSRDRPQWDAVRQHSTTIKEIHMATNKPFTCPVCGAEFATRRELEEHGQTAHPDMAGKSQAGTGSPGSGKKDQR